MKRALIAVTCLLVLLAGLWMAGPYLFQGEAVYTIVTRSEGKSALVLRVERPGLMVDVKPPVGKGQRFFTLFRGPLEVTLSEGDGPFDLSDLPRPAAGGEPRLALPDGWRQAGHYAGRFQVAEGSPVSVALPVGVTDPADAADKVRKLYAAAETLFGRPPVREKLAVVTGSQPEHLALAVAELWIPDYAADAAWLETGATQFYAVKLLDQLKLWATKDRDKWLKVNQPEKSYAIAIWLDASLRINTQKKFSLHDVLVQSRPGLTEKEVVALVNQIGGLGVSDHLDRMLKGQEPLPVTR